MTDNAQNRMKTQTHIIALYVQVEQVHWRYDIIWIVHLANSEALTSIFGRILSTLLLAQFIRKYSKSPNRPLGYGKWTQRIMTPSNDRSVRAEKSTKYKAFIAELFHNNIQLSWFDTKQESQLSMITASAR